MKNILNISLALILIVVSPLVSRPDPVDLIPYEEVVGVWTLTQNGFDHSFTGVRVLELCKTIIWVNYPDLHTGSHLRLKSFDQEMDVNGHTLEPCTFVDNVQSCLTEAVLIRKAEVEYEEPKRTLHLYEKVRENVYDISALKPDGKTVSKQQTMYACPVKILDVPKWIENDMESKFVVKNSVKGAMFRRLVDGKWGWFGVLFERKVEGKWQWQVIGYEKKNPKYSGEIQNGLPNGQGIIAYPDGDKYEGQLKNGRLNGQGIYTFNDGGIYVGQWKDSQIHGQGTLNWSDGRKYEGKWKDGTWNGQGTFIFPDGRKYVGEFKVDKPWNIKGYDKNGNIIAKWVNGKKQ